MLRGLKKRFPAGGISISIQKNASLETVLKRKLFCIRHGKPTIQYPSSLTDFIPAARFNELLDHYDLAGLDPEWNRARALSRICGYSVSSDLPRALETAVLYTGRSADQIVQDKLFREVPLPRYRTNVKLPAFALLFLSRFGWFSGTMKGVESYRESVNRVRNAADYLENTTRAHRETALFSHGFFLWMLHRELVSRGWETEKKGPFRYLEIAEYTSDL